MPLSFRPLTFLSDSSRRRLLIAVAAVAGALAAGCAGIAGRPASADKPPIVFVHGNGDTAALWMTTMWRFESNGWPRERLHAIDMPFPNARDDDGVAQPGRSSTEEHMRYLASEVDKVLARTGAKQVVLVGNSRGGYAIRNYIRNGGGAAKVSHAVLGGTPNHGVWANPGFRPGNEFNGSGPFLRALNAPQGPNGEEVSPGPKWMTLRSDSNDKFAQPDGVWIGARGTPTNVTHEGPALKGAGNLVLPARDHREVSFHPEAFARTYEFITGRAPARSDIAPEATVVLQGKVSGIGPGGPTNLPLPGATVEVYAVDASGARLGGALHRRTVGPDGLWGPFAADPGTAYEFVVGAPGYATTHYYRSPFPRSSDVVHLRARRIADADKGAVAIVSLDRPRGYFGIPRDRIVFDGQSPPPGVPGGVAGISTSTVKPTEPGRSVVAQFDSVPVSERIAGRAWPAAENHVTVLEMHY